MKYFDPRRRKWNIRAEVQWRLAMQRSGCFLLAAERGRMRCPAKGMRILHDCLYSERGRTMDQTVCGPVIDSVSKRVRELDVLRR